MGPTFGIKGGAAGGGYSQVVPMERLNLHLTGDFHAVTAAHNLLAAMIDNYIHHSLRDFPIDLHSITWRRVLDVSDRVLRSVVVGLGAPEDGVTRQTGFDITAASEVMAVLALSTSLKDMRQRLGRMVIGLARDGKPITADFLHAGGAMAVIMRDAIKPNLLQTLENTPVLVHAGPFGNIANGASSVLADLIGIHGGEYLVTEAGFGADMGAERFFNIKCRTSGLAPDAAVVVATVRALKVHSGKYRVVAGRPLPPELLKENPDDVLAGAANLRKQVENIQIHGVTPVVAINAFPDDHASEHQAIRDLAEHLGVRSAVCNNFADGRRGRAGGGGNRRSRRAEHVPVPVPGRGDAPREDRGDRAPRLRRAWRRVRPRRRQAARRLRGERIRPAARLHRQDTPLHLVGSQAEGGPDGVGAAGTRGAGIGRRGFYLPDLRRDAHHARPADDAERHQHRPGRKRRDRRLELTAQGCWPESANRAPNSPRAGSAKAPSSRRRWSADSNDVQSICAAYCCNSAITLESRSGRLCREWRRRALR